MVQLAQPVILVQQEQLVQPVQLELMVQTALMVQTVKFTIGVDIGKKMQAQRTKKMTL
jgi:hypothetical protein